MAQYKQTLPVTVQLRLDGKFCRPIILRVVASVRVDAPLSRIKKPLLKRRGFCASKGRDRRLRRDLESYPRTDGPSRRRPLATLETGGKYGRGRHYNTTRVDRVSPLPPGVCLCTEVLVHGGNPSQQTNYQLVSMGTG